jgi:hypothetical protein
MQRSRIQTYLGNNSLFLHCRLRIQSDISGQIVAAIAEAVTTAVQKLECGSWQEERSHPRLVRQPRTIYASQTNLRSWLVQRCAFREWFAKLFYSNSQIHHDAPQILLVLGTLPYRSVNCLSDYTNEWLQISVGRVQENWLYVYARWRWLFS